MTVPNGFSRRLSVTVFCNVFVVPLLSAQTGSALAAVPGSARLAGLGGAGGASVQNIGGDLGGGLHLPRRTRAGFTMNYFDPQGSYRLLTTVEGQWPSRGTGGGSPFLVLGVEGGVVKPGLGLLARVGYVGHSVTTAAAPFTWGGSLELGRLHLDYAYRADDTLGARQRMGLRWTP